MRGRLSYPGPGPMSWSTVLFVLPGPMSWSTVLFVLPGLMSRSPMLFVLPGLMSRPAGPVMRSMTIMGECCPALAGSDEPVGSFVYTTGSDEPVDSVVVTSSADTVSVVTTGVAFQQKCDVPSGAVCDDYCYDEHYDENPDYFDYDDPGDFDNYPDVYGFIEPDDY